MKENWLLYLAIMDLKSNMKSFEHFEFLLEKRIFLWLQKL